MEQHEAALLRYVAHLLPADAGEAAEDIAQEAFLRLHRQVETHGDGSVRKVSTWLFRVARNLAMDSRRRKLRDRKARKTLMETVEHTVEEVSDPGDDAARREMCARAMAELDALPDKQREVLVLRVVEDMKMREIAEVMDISISNVAYHLNNGLRQLAGRLKTAGLT